ncbi:nuclear transport factor 2 family protein [Flavobacteriaceae bacterium YJPT1-3]|nr:nuclear transport factor 2 family protein [Flavobacteriaceae bacterium YJPT1-3]
MKTISTLVIALMMLSCQGQETTEATPVDPVEIKAAVNQVLYNWHKAAAEADFDTYFGLMTKDAVFLGTDATENWTRQEFEAFSKPYFEAGKAWSFTKLERNVFVGEAGNVVWFDEHLKTQMGICRGSGVLTQEDGQWKVQHYVLSIAVPNEHVSELTALKKAKDSVLMRKMQTPY